MDHTKRHTKPCTDPEADRQTFITRGQPPDPAMERREPPSEAPLVREISAACEEFARSIRAGFADALTTPSGWKISWQSASATIDLSPLPDLVIASLRLPRQRCVITLTDGSAPDRQALLTRLDRYQQRGGG